MMGQDCFEINSEDVLPTPPSSSNNVSENGIPDSSTRPRMPPLMSSWQNADTKHAVHCLLFARTKQEVGLEENVKEGFTKLKAIVLMHMRFDGLLGFPGGMVDNSVIGLTNEEFNDELVGALQRELYEELGISDSITSRVKPENYLFYSERPRRSGGKVVMHFYSLELTESEIKDIEQGALRCSDYGEEVLGNVRVPLYTMCDGFRGLPAFLTNSFAGTARQQLLSGLKCIGIMTQAEVEKAVNASDQKKHSGPPLLE